MPILLLSNPLDADDAQRIGLADIRNYAVGEQIIVDDFAAQTLIRVGYGIAVGSDVEVLIIGSGSPNASIGADGQWYLDELAEVLWGPKTGGSWPSNPIRPDRGVAHFDIVNYHLIVTYTSGAVRDLGDIRGPRGIDSTIVVGTVGTGAAGSAVTIGNSGTPNSAVLDFVIPRGDKGVQGDRGFTGYGYGGGFATGGVVNGVITTTIMSPWGLRADGTVYYNADGALPAEAALLMPDATANAFVLFRPGAPTSTLFRDKVVELAGGVIDGRRGAVNGLASLGADGKVPLAQLPTNIGSGGGGGDAGTVTVDAATDPLGVTITSNWGVTDAGVIYYDTAGAVAAEAGLLVPDPLNDAFAVFRPGGPWTPTGVQSVDGQTGVVVLDKVTQAQLTAGINTARLRPVNAQPASYTLIGTDAGGYVSMNAAAALTVTVPAEATVPWATGTVIDIAQTGAGRVTVAPAAGVTITSLNGGMASLGQYAIMRLTKTGANLWRLSGDLVSLDKPRVTARRSTSAAVAGSTETPVTFTGISSRSTAAMWSASNPTRLVATEDGEYDLSAYVPWASSANVGAVSTSYRINGLTTRRSYMDGRSSNTYYGSEQTPMFRGIDLVAGEYVEVYVLQNTDTTRTIAAGITATLDLARR